MEYCIKCGVKLPEKAEFCTKCGTPIKSSDEPKKEIKDKKSIEEQIEETAEGIGKKAEQIGKKIGSDQAKELIARIIRSNRTRFQPLEARFRG